MDCEGVKGDNRRNRLPMSLTMQNGREYERFAGREIAVPRARADRPDAELLGWHAAEVFRG